MSGFIHPSRQVPVPSAPGSAAPDVKPVSLTAAAAAAAGGAPAVKAQAAAAAAAPVRVVDQAPVPNFRTGRLLSTVQALLPGAPANLLTKIALAEDAIRRDPYDVESWLVLWNCAATPSVALSTSRVIYEQFLLVFPTAARYWKHYVEEEIQAGNYDRVEKLFMRCLLKCFDMDLWKTYIRYIKLVKAGAKDENRALEECYEFVLRHMGSDLNAADVWLAYINFLKTAPTANAYEEGQKIAKIRKVYQRCVVLPIVNVELVWRDYDQFEHKLNKALAKGLLGEYISRFTLAKACCHERRHRSNGILWSMLARPAREGVHTQQRDYQQVILWRRFIRYECSNPLNLDPPLLKARVVFAYKQALLTVRHYPELWYEYALYVGSTGSQEESVAVFREALSALPYSLLMAFMYADWEEERKNFPVARAVYESLLPENESKRPAAAAGAGAAAAAAAAAAASGSSDTSVLGGMDIPPIPSDVGVVTSDGTTWILPQPLPLRAPSTLPAADPLVYIQYMRFLRRTEGVEPARKAFILARKSKAVTWHTFVAAGRMEYEVNNQPKVASKLFALGFSEYQAVPAFVLQYLDFLIAINDHSNLRVVFERVLPLIPAKDATEIWARYIEFERGAGDLQSLMKLEARRAMAYGRSAAPKVSDAIERYRFLDRYPVSAAYRETIKRATAQFRDTKDRTEGAVLMVGDGTTLDAAQVAAYKARFPRPQTSQMIEYQVGEREGPGAAERERERERQYKMYEKFVPDSIRTLLRQPMLPSVHAYKGAYINVDMLLQLVAGIDDSAIAKAAADGAPTDAPGAAAASGSSDAAAAAAAAAGPAAGASDASEPVLVVRDANAAGADPTLITASIGADASAIPLPGAHAQSPPGAAAVSAAGVQSVGDKRKHTDGNSNGTGDAAAAAATAPDEPAAKKAKTEPVDAPAPAAPSS